MDSILVVCYSSTGVSKRAAQLLCSQRGWPLGEVADVKPRAGAAGTLRSVLDSLLRRKPPIRYTGPDPADFRTVVLVAPVWACSLAGPMRSFVADNADQLRRVAVVSTMGSAGASGAVAEVARYLGRAPVLAAAFTQRELEDGSGTHRLLAVGDDLVPPSAKRQPAHPGLVHA